MELILLLLIVGVVIVYRNYRGENIGKFIKDNVDTIYEKYAPFSFKVVREKTKQLGKEYTVRQYTIQIVLFSTFAGVITYLYFYNIFISIVYIIIVDSLIPYLSYLRCKRVYSEFIFEQVQVYTSNTIMEFATTQSFVKSIEGVRDSGVLEDPVKTDVEHMIELAYDNGTIDESLTYMSNLYPYYIVKNMHQLFLQITKEGARNSADSLENMQLDIDMLVESVYRDRQDRATFHKQFLQFGIMLYFLLMLTQLLLGRESYLILLEKPIVKILMHLAVIINSNFLLRGEKYYNENVGAE